MYCLTLSTRALICYSWLWCIFTDPLDWLLILFFWVLQKPFYNIYFIVSYVSTATANDLNWKCIRLFRKWWIMPRPSNCPNHQICQTIRLGVVHKLRMQDLHWPRVLSNLHHVDPWIAGGLSNDWLPFNQSCHKSIVVPVLPLAPHLHESWQLL